MRKLTLLILYLWMITNSAYAQKPVPVADKMLRDSIGENLLRNTKQLGLLEVIRRQTKATQEVVEATYQLQRDYQEFLRTTASTASLTVSDQSTDQRAVIEVVQAGQHLADYGFAANLNQRYHSQTEPMEKSAALYEQLVPYDEQVVFSDLAAFQADQKAQNLHVVALQEMSQRRKLQLAEVYRKMAEQKVRQADELRVLLMTDQQFSMTERERLAILTQMQQALQESQDLTAQADELMRQSTQPSWTKEQAIKAYRHQQERNTIASTPLFIP